MLALSTFVDDGYSGDLCVCSSRATVSRQIWSADRVRASFGLCGGLSDVQFRQFWVSGNYNLRGYLRWTVSLYQRWINVDHLHQQHDWVW